MKFKTIQGIRGIAILMIVLWHLNSIFPGNLPALGDRGVEFFFLISGFLIGMKYYDSEKFNSLKMSLAYSVGKAKVIYPMYILSTIPMIVFLVKELYNMKISMLDFCVRVGANLLLVQSWIPNQDVYWSLNGVTWFLSSLLVCYGTIFLFFKFIRKKGSIFSLLFFLAMEFVWEAIFYFFFIDKYIFLAYIFPLFRALDFGIGICLGISYNKQMHKENEKYYSIFLPIILVVYVGIIMLFNKKVCYSGYHIIEAVIVWTIMNSKSKVKQVLFENKIIVKMGDISDDIFLIHLPLITFFSILWSKLVRLKNLKLLEWLLLIVLILLVALIINRTREIIVKYKMKNEI